MRIRKWKEWMSWKSSYIIWLMLLRGFLEDPQRQEANGTILFPLIDINTCVRKSTYQHINLPLVLRPCWSIFLGDWPYCELLCLTTSICFFFLEMVSLGITLTLVWYPYLMRGTVSAVTKAKPAAGHQALKKKTRSRLCYRPRKKREFKDIY